MLKNKVYIRDKKDGFKTKEFKVKTLQEFRPFLKFEDRIKWNLIDPEIKKIIEDNVCKYKKINYPLLRATDFMEYFRTGNRVAYEEKYFERRHAVATLVLSYCINPDKDVMDDIINGIWCICEESSWAVPAHNFIYEPELINNERTLQDTTLPILDIFAGETGMLLAMCYYVLKNELDRVEPLVARRIQKEIKERIIMPFLTRYDYWWMGYSDRRDINNWGPWCVINCLICILFCEQDDHLRKRAIVRAMDMMDYYLQGVSLDGGCDEGATYWGRACGMLLEGLSLVHYATDGEIDIYNEEKLINFTDYIRKMYIGRDYVVNFADGAAKCNPAAEIVYTAGEHMNNRLLKEFGAYCYKYQLDNGNFPYLSLSRALASLDKSSQMLKLANEAYFEMDHYIESLEIMIARQYPVTEEGFFVCSKGGNNNDSHNHNDVGNLVCFYNCNPILVDIGVEVYRKEFFGPNRYDIWTMQSQYHNLPTINGIMQKNGEEFRATQAKHSYEGEKSIFECELHTAYPEIKGLESYTRRVTLDRGFNEVEIVDSYNASQWIDISFNFITPCEIMMDKQGIILTYKGESVKISLDRCDFDIEVEYIELKDTKLIASWGEKLNRIILKTRVSHTSYSFKIVPYNNLEE